MSKISDNAAAAFLAGQPFSNGNTRVVRPDSRRARLYLHNHLIAQHTLSTGRIEATLAGWPTTTTRSRLNAIADAIGAPRIRQKTGQQYFGDQRLSYTKWFILRTSQWK